MVVLSQVKSDFYTAVLKNKMGISLKNKLNTRKFEKTQNSNKNLIKPKQTKTQKEEIIKPEK